MRGNRARRSPSTIAVRLGLRCAIGALIAGALIAASLASCAPAVETPAEAGYRRDLRDAERLTASLLHLPLVRAAHVTLTRPVDDPLRPRVASSAAAAATATASVVLTLDGRADPAALTSDARALAVAIAPELTPAAITVLARPTEPPPAFAKVGPFDVARRSRAPLLLAFFVLLAACAGLGITLAARERARRAGAAPAPR